MPINRVLTLIFTLSPAIACITYMLLFKSMDIVMQWLIITAFTANAINLSLSDWLLDRTLEDFKNYLEEEK